MQFRYSATTGFFYPVDMDYQNLPDDIIFIEEADFMLAVAARDRGDTFKFVDGILIITPKPPVPIDPNEEKRTQIRLIEQRATARRIREAILGIDNGWLQDINDQIQAIRDTFE